MSHRACADLQVGDRITLLDRICTVTAEPEGLASGRVRFTVSLPGGAPQHLLEDPGVLVELLP